MGKQGTAYHVEAAFHLYVRKPPSRDMEDSIARCLTHVMRRVFGPPEEFGIDRLRVTVLPVSEPADPPAEHDPDLDRWLSDGGHD